MAGCGAAQQTLNITNTKTPITKPIIVESSSIWLNMGAAHYCCPYIVSSNWPKTKQNPVLGFYAGLVQFHDKVRC
jgi:hypothetical protein